MLAAKVSSDDVTYQKVSSDDVTYHAHHELAAKVCSAVAAVAAVILKLLACRPCGRALICVYVCCVGVGVYVHNVCVCVC